jgi:hypothetical protein
VVRSPEKLKPLLAELKRYPHLSYHAVNAAGQEYTNTPYNPEEGRSPLQGYPP